jgi:aminocarboxymuconate-semialdehyde decarboxylase
MKLIDAHAHFVPQHFPALPAGVPADQWPSMVPRPDGSAAMMLGVKEFRVFESAYWDIAERIATLDAEGIGLQVMSPLPELLSYWLDLTATAALAHHTNAAIAAAAAAAPQRLAGIGMLPMQEPGAAAAMVPGIAALGLRGVLIASNINGISAADARFYPVYAALEAHGLALFVHGYRPAGAERFIGSPLLTPIIGAPQDAMAAVASFMMVDIFARFPALKIGIAHGGGAFGAVLDRMNHVWHEFPEMRQTLKIPPRDYVKKFVFDTVTFSDSYLRYLIEVAGPACLMAGSDGPTPIGQRGLGNFVTTACRGDAQAASQILSLTAETFFGVACPASPSPAKIPESTI